MAQSPQSLEDQLRSMILSNVSVGTDSRHANPRSSYPSAHPRAQPYPGFHGHAPHDAQPPASQQSRQSCPSAGSFQDRGSVGQNNGVAPPFQRPPGIPSSPRNRAANSRNYQGPQARVQTAAKPAPHAPHPPHGGYHGVQHPPRILQRPQAPPGIQRPHAPPGLEHVANGAPPTGVAQASPQRSGFLPRNQLPFNEIFTAQCRYLDQIAAIEIPKVEMTAVEQNHKEDFRLRLEAICREALADGYTGGISSIELKCFGSLSSGFATQGSDMDLAIVPIWKNSSRLQSAHIEQEVPRLLEKHLLKHGYGARLLTRTRVPILKVCEKPTPELYAALCEERQKWDDLPEGEKYAPPGPLQPEEPKRDEEPSPGSAKDAVPQTPENRNSGRFDALKDGETNSDGNSTASHMSGSPTSSKDQPSTDLTESPTTPDPKQQQPRAQRTQKQWLREKVLGPLDFPKSGIGIQCDINFSNELALHNTALLRCYSLCDARVRPMVLFIKAWAKRRKINSPYSGTLSSYGYVLMVLHYLVNVARPPVLPNLQLVQMSEPGSWHVAPLGAEHEIVVADWPVRFWRDEERISLAAREGRLSRNRDPLAALLRGFFQYYAVTGHGGHGPGATGFQWTQDVLSLRTPGGLRSKQDKGWTGAKTTLMDKKEVRHRYLFAIEDPFELDHNVARTVTHNGICAIRDELRRAWGILNAVGRGLKSDGDLFDAVVEAPPPTPPPTAQHMEGAGEARKDGAGLQVQQKDGAVAAPGLGFQAEAVVRAEQNAVERQVGNAQRHVDRA